MKYCIVLLIVSFLSFSANCQLDKGYWLAGGAGNAYFYNEEYKVTDRPAITGNLTEINLSGNVGYFVLDKFAVGIRPGIKSIKSKGLNTGSVGTKEIAVFVGPFARYYFLNAEKPFNILLDVGYQTGVYTTYVGKGSMQNFSALTGSEIFFNSAIGLEFLFGYMHHSTLIQSEPAKFITKRNGLYMSIGLQFHLIND